MAYCVCGHVNDLTEVILSVSDINLQLSMWNLYPVISAKTPHCSPFIPSMGPSQDGDAHVWLISDR